MEFMYAKGFNMNEVLDKVFIGLQRRSNNPIAKRETPFDGIEQYLYVRMDSVRSFKVPENLASETLWEVAKRNTFAETDICSLATIMSEMMGIEVPEMEPAQYVVKNYDGFRGAACVLNRTALKDLAVRLGVDRFFMLPSSIHEVLLIPDTGEFKKEDLDKMVQNVNAMEVEYEDQLGDHAYVIKF